MPINAYPTYPAFNFRRHAGRLYFKISSYPNQPEHIYTNLSLPSQTEAISNQPTNTSAYPHQPGTIYTNQALPSQTQALSDQPTNTSAYPHQPGTIYTNQALPSQTRAPTY